MQLCIGLFLIVVLAACNAYPENQLDSITTVENKVDILWEAFVRSVEKDGQTMAHFAAKTGSTKVLQLAIKSGANINVQDKDMKSPLHYAAANGNKEIVEMLIQNGVDVDASDSNGETPLALAVAKGHGEIVDLLTKNGADFKVIGKNGKNLLHLVLESGNDQLVDLLIEKGIDVNAKDSEGNTPLLLAASNDDNEKLVEKLIKHGANVGATDKRKRTALHIAATHGAEKVTELLIKSGIDVDALDEVEETALHKVAEHGNDKIAELLIKAGANINGRNNEGRTPIHISAQHGTSKVADLLVKAKADLNVLDVNDQTPYKVARNSDYFAKFEDVLRKNAKKSGYNGQIKDDTKLLIAAVLEGNIARIENLIKMIDINGRDSRSGKTALIEAVESGHEPVIEFLIKNGANVNILGFRGQSPLHIAISHGYANIVRCLLENGADVNATSTSNQIDLFGRTYSITPFRAAIKKDNKEIVKILIQHGADVMEVDEFSGMSPIAEAALRGNEEMVELLLENVTNITETVSILGKTLAHLANDVNVNGLNTLIKAGADVNAVDEDGRTALINIAIRSGDAEKIELLIKAGANVNYVDRMGVTPLYRAIRHDNVAAVNSLLKHGASISSIDITKLLPAFESNVEMIKCLISNGVDLSAVKNDKGSTLLHLAVMRGDRELPALLIKNGFDVNARAGDNRMPLDFASGNFGEEAIPLLIENGASLDHNTSSRVLFWAISNHNEKIVELYLNKHGFKFDMDDGAKGNTPFHYVAATGDMKIFQMLLNAAGIDASADPAKKKLIHRPNVNGETPLFWAAYNDYYPDASPIPKLLIQHCADLNSKDKTMKRTPLHHAAIKGKLEIVQLLLKSGAIIEAEDREWKTALDLAKRYDHPEIEKLLKDAETVPDERPHCSVLQKSTATE